MTDSGTPRREIAKTKAKKKAKGSRALKKKAEERPKNQRRNVLKP